MESLESGQVKGSVSKFRMSRYAVEYVLLCLVFLLNPKLLKSLSEGFKQQSRVAFGNEAGSK